MAGKDGGKGGKPPGGRGPSKEEGGKRPPGLTKNEKLVWDVLAEANGPLKAYEILDKLKERNVRAPMTVYRALDGLEGKGFIHKLDGLNAFVLCNHEGPHQLQTFLYCTACKTVKEVDIDSVTPSVAQALRRGGFEMQWARLDVRGVCSGCSSGHEGHVH